MPLTESLCPVCLQRVPAERETLGNDVYLVKSCHEHGLFRVALWRGEPSFASWRRPKIPTTPPLIQSDVHQGCPFDCGLCPDHRQRSCTILFEVTGRCDLACPICFADAGPGAGPDPSLDTIDGWFRTARRAGNSVHVQLSGGEPTVREDLPEIIRLGAAHGFGFIQLNTNGLRLAADEAYARRLRQAGLASVFLQFDGTDDRVYRRMRGRDLMEAKLQAIDVCGRNNLGVVLVPTLVPGINTAEIGPILRLAVARSPVVRAVHFQPVSYFGRFPRTPLNADRLTLPELMRAIETQTQGLFPTAAFRPPGCENALCSFHADFLIEADGGVRPLHASPQPCCSSEPERAEEGAARTVARVAGQWSAPNPNLGAEGPPVGSAPSCHGPDRLISLDDFIRRARTHTLSVSAMAFQDAWTMDLERLRDCCIHVMSPEGRLIPFCAYNLTGADGLRLYRP